MPSVSCPAILVAAPASGQGKTTVACALARWHTRQGRRVRVFKCGPDFLDPHWLALASGAPVHQLDLWMTGEADCRQRLHQAAQQADLLIVEGVMGLFDGAPSAADLAQRFDLPVLAVVDASAMAGTFGALALGLQHYRPGLRWAGVLANRVAGERHADMLRASLREPAHWLGALMRNPALALPERHLGLTVASEVDDAMARLDAAADALAGTTLTQMSGADLQRWAVSFEPAASAAAPATGAQPLLGTTVAVARDAAFCFIYAANLECLQALGAKVAFFSPLADAALPDCDAVWLPGGYPELHAEQLARNRGLRDGLAAHVAQHKPVWAECGGMMVLFDQLVTRDGETHAQWGLLPGRITMQQRLAALGPQQLVIDGQLLRGHTFHYSTCATPLAVRTRTARPGCETAPDAGEALYEAGSLRASYFHAWFASNPQAVAALFARRTVTGGTVS
ncbi:cobyrinate a,c-diamide synthase [Rhodoferax sediminis]|uniref:Cobyrinate a,c-diamide synthase n=1 Tax=Rhodoferax sediminis TaxID=2509614 RepID=A0A515D7N3_9BURK|nr:cobyrinate a,c-diamide synthase [Rhodoferax sediminis]QDL36398.1 cobyrinate a,c-diamide synthase [Rhodoferax sediminis]